MEDPGDDIVTLVSDNNETFAVSHSKLALGSLYYERLLRSGMKDARDTKLRLSLLNESGLRAVSEYLRTGRVSMLGEADVSDLETLRSALEAGSYLQMEGLIALCEKSLISLVSANFWKDVLDISNDFYLQEPKSSVLTYLCTNFVECSTTEEFLSLTVEDLIEVLSSDETDCDEVDIFKVALTWILFESNRCDNLFKVFDAVRFPLMSNGQIRDCIVALETNGFHEYSAKLSEENSDVQRNKVKLRCTTRAVLATGGFTVKEHSTSRLQLLPLDTLECYKSGDSSKVIFLSCRSQKLPANFCEHGSCVFNNVLYIAGGQSQYCRDGRYTTNRVHCFDPILGVWSLCTSMQVPRSLFFFGELDGNLYAVTGCTAPNMDTPTVERYFPTEDRWQIMNSVPIEVHELAGN